MRYLGIDYGDAKVGFAYGEAETKMAFARETYRHQSVEDLHKKIGELVAEDRIDAFVVGYPTNLEGNKTEQTKKVDLFIESLKEHFKKDVFIIDEHLTSYEAQERIKEGSSHEEDSIAAQIILQNYLDSQ